MPDPSPADAKVASRRLWLIIAVLLAPAIVLPLVVPIYDHEDPTFVGFPFYYWFQFLLIIIAVALTVPAYLVAKRVDRSDRVLHRLPPEPPDDRPATDRRAGDAR